MNTFTAGTVVWQSPSGRLHAEQTCPIRAAGKTRAIEILDLNTVQDRMCDCFHPHWLVGERVSIPAHLDAWMAGSRYGRVVWVDQDRDVVRVKPDNRAEIRLLLSDFGFTYGTV